MTRIADAFMHSLVAIFVAMIGMLASQISLAGDDADQTALLQALGKSKLTLAEGLKLSTKDAEVPISAKFEFDDHRQLSLSIYTAGKGLAVDAEHNVLKELSGSPEKTPWEPEVEVFKDPEHVARASEQLTLTALAKHSLFAITAQAKKDHAGTVFSIAPALRGKRPVFIVLVADKGKVAEYAYDAMTGKSVASKQ
jgi:uncharacterized membrane protein YkoI